ncbi:hypothetical protein ASE40_20170 [Flavobacterium sp. Root935]|jgi:hypothetical protein|uniref:hypothetical protein n=1 Tax=Flavobacterium sp. Root935 TaxID=1736610 RepID=UPI0007092199|nr:hypothetical protein [Flavobacterium sp. Root935]KRD58635.1 hypothetical protein ASE40_20170 [Flavobacterium sp. Root935]
MKKYQPSIEEIDQKLDQTIKQKFSSGYMSNKKWVKLIDTFVENAELIKRVEIKKVLEEKIGLIFISENLQYEFDYWNIGFEGVNSFGGWLLYKEIEFLKFPAKFQNENSYQEQDLIEIKEIINKIGVFEMTDQNDELILFCYK